MSRLTTLVIAAAVAAGGFAATAASAAPICEISVHDHTPGTYPGGMHVHNSCFDVSIHTPELPPLS